MKNFSELAKAAGAVALSHRVAVYIPSTVAVDKAAVDKGREVLEAVARRLSDLFGGATATAATGYWTSEAVGLVREAVTIVYAACTSEALEAHGAEVLEIAQAVKCSMEQEAVSVEVDGALYLV